MINQLVFFLGLYLLGFFFGLIWKKDIPFVFITITGFLWGSLFWVLSSIFVLTIGMPYFANTIILLVSFMVLLGYHLRKGTLQFTPCEISYFSIALVLFSLVLTLTSQYNFSLASYDSIVQIVLGGQIGQNGFTQETTMQLASWGVFLPVMQSASFHLKIDYLYALQPLFSLSLFFLFFYITQRALRLYIKSQKTALILTFLVTGFLASTYFLIFQTFYIHNNLLAATYLFTFLGTGWLAINEKNNRWFLFSALALTGFSIVRTEAPLFALPFFAFFLGTGKMPYHLRIKYFLPSLFFLLFWYFYLLNEIGSGSDILNPQKIWLIIVFIILFIAFLMLSKLSSIEKRLLPFLPDIIIAVLILSVIIFFALDTSHMLRNITAILENMIVAGNWGVTWGLTLGLLLLSVTQPSFSYERVLTQGIIFFFSMLMSLGFMRIPFRIGWGDSANRIITHILPIILFYLTVKYGHGFFHSEKQDDNIRHRRSILGFIGGGGLVVVLFWLLPPNSILAILRIIKNF